MNCFLTAILAIALAPGDSGNAVSATADNSLLDALLQTGVTLSDGSSVKLPPPTMPDGLGTAGQQAAIARLANANHPVDELMRRSIVAPFELVIRPIGTAAGRALARGVDVHFVVYGNWEAINSREFLESLTNLMGSRRQAPQSPASGFLSRDALSKRGIAFSPRAGREEGAYFTTVSMFDRVELRATRHVVITRLPASATIAARIDPRFNSDAEYPNQWRSMKRDLDNPQDVAFGPPQTYTSAGFYGKITRLAEPGDAMLVEYHVVFEEPEAWFQGANLLSSKLPLVIQDVVRSLRRKMANLADGKPQG